MKIIRELEMGRIYIGDKDRPDAYVRFQIDKDILRLEQVVVDKALEGQGIGTRLVEEMILVAKDANKVVDPICWFARDYFKKHPEVKDLLWVDPIR